MNRRLPTLLLLILVLFFGCNRRENDAEVQAFRNQLKKRSGYAPQIEEGLVRLFYCLNIPLGDVQIMSDLSSSVENSDFDRKVFQQKYLPFLQTAQRLNLVELQEQPQSQMEMMASAGARKFHVTSTPNASQMCDPKRTNSEWLYVPLAATQLTNIVKETPFQNPTLAPGEDYLLVMGTYAVTYNEFAKNAAGYKDKEFKFRALLKLNPFGII